MSKLAKKTKTPRKTQKKQSTENQKNNSLNIKISPKRGPVFTFSFPGVAARPPASYATAWKRSCQQTNELIGFVLAQRFKRGDGLIEKHRGRKIMLQTAETW